ALLLGLAEPAAGRIEIGGVDLADCDLAAWRSRLAWVPQHPTLFRGTVAENVRLGRPESSDAEVRDAARRAGADRFVERLPLGDVGLRLSGADRRRLPLARAHVRGPDLPVRDEPTADLDPESAELVGDAIEELRGEATILLIAHRPQFAQLADRAVELRDGRA